MQLSSLPCCCHSPSVSWTCLGSVSLFSLGCPSWLLRMTSVTTHSPEAPPHSEGVGQSCTVTLPHCQGGQRVGACQSHDPKLLWCSSNKTIHRRTSWFGWSSFGRTTFSVINENIFKNCVRTSHRLITAGPLQKSFLRSCNMVYVTS